MKCPKCGYNSFEYLDQCKKCGHDLAVFKESNGIRSVLVPAVAKGDEVSVVGISGVQQDAGGAPADETFSWDEPADDTSIADVGATEKLDDFSFSEPAAGNEASLDDLLESSATLQRETNSGGGGQTKPAANSVENFASSAGEFEMADFFGDQPEQQTETAPPQAAKPAQELVDGDFDFLFSTEEEKQ